jgi:putative FmdB family regulatory protein
MPLYEYQCDDCRRRFEVIQRFSDAPVETCSSCGGHVHRLLSAAAIQFKGSGWYITDYAKKGISESSKPADTSSAEKPSSSSSDSSSSSSSSKGPASRD